MERRAGELHRGDEVKVPDPESNPAALRVPTYEDRVGRLERDLARVRDGSTPTFSRGTWRG